MDIQGYELQKEIERYSDLERELTQNLDSELGKEEEILAASLSIAEGLIKSTKVRTEIEGDQFSIAMSIRPIMVKKMHITTKEVIEVPEDHIVLIAANVDKYRLTGGKYLPFTAKAKVDRSYSLLDNVKTVVEGLIRHITGNIKPEILE